MTLTKYLFGYALLVIVLPFTKRSHGRMVVSQWMAPWFPWRFTEKQ